MGERASPTALHRRRHGWGCPGTTCSLSPRDHPPGSKEGSTGAACTLSSERGFTCLRVKNRVNNSVSPPVRTRQLACPRAQSRAALSPQTWHRTCLHKTWQLWDCQSIFLIPLAGGWEQHRTPCLGNQKGLVLGQVDMPV